MNLGKTLLAAVIALVWTSASFADAGYQVNFSFNGFVGEQVTFEYTMGNWILGPKSLDYGNNLHFNFEGNKMSIIGPFIYATDGKKYVYTINNSCSGMSVSPTMHNIVFQVNRSVSNGSVDCRVVG